jgi:hypothetical protein
MSNESVSSPDNNSLYSRHKTVFIMNALQDGWTIKKVNDSFVFSKKHENKKEIFLESYLEKFIKNNLHERKV